MVVLSSRSFLLFDFTRFEIAAETRCYESNERWELSEKSVLPNTFERDPSTKEATIIERFQLFPYLLIREINERFEDPHENSRIINLKRRIFFV